MACTLRSRASIGILRGVTIERYFIAYDIGRAVNPMLVQGQLAGGMAQGIGGALLEEFLYDERGEPLSVNFADYLMPTSREVPQLELLITEDAPSPLNPLGLKGAGEGGINAVGAAVAAAIDDAIGNSGGDHAAAGHPAAAARNSQGGQIVALTAGVPRASSCAAVAPAGLLSSRLQNWSASRRAATGLRLRTCSR